MSSKSKGLNKLINKLGLTKSQHLTKEATIVPSMTATGVPGSGEYAVGTQGWRQDQASKPAEIQEADPLRVAANGYRMVIDNQNGFIYFIRTTPDIPAETEKAIDEIRDQYLANNQEYNNLDPNNPEAKKRIQDIRREAYALAKEQVKDPKIQAAIARRAQAAVGKPLTYQDINNDASDRGMVFNDESLQPINQMYASYGKPLHGKYNLGDNDLPVMITDESLDGMLSQHKSDTKLTPEMISLQLLNTGRARQIALGMQNLDNAVKSDMYFGWDDDPTYLNTFAKEEAKKHFKALPQQYLDAILTLPEKEREAILQNIGYDPKDTSKALATIESHLQAKANLAYEQSRAFDYVFRNAAGNGYNFEGSTPGSKGLFNSSSTGYTPIQNTPTANVALMLAHSQVAPGAMQWYRTNFDRDNFMQSDIADSVRNSWLGRTADISNEAITAGLNWATNGVANLGYNLYQDVTTEGPYKWQNNKFVDYTPYTSIVKPTNLALGVADGFTGGTISQMGKGIEAGNVRDITLPNLMGASQLNFSENSDLRKMDPETAQNLMVLKNLYTPGRTWDDDGGEDVVMGTIGTATLPFLGAGKVVGNGAKAVITGARVALKNAPKQVLRSGTQSFKNSLKARGKIITDDFKNLPKDFSLKNPFNWSPSSPFGYGVMTLTDPFRIGPKTLPGWAFMGNASEKATPVDLTLASDFYNPETGVMTGSSYQYPYQDYMDITGQRNYTIADYTNTYQEKLKALKEAENAAATHTQYKPIDSNMPTTTIKAPTKPNTTTSTTQNNFSQYAPYALAGASLLGLGALALNHNSNNTNKDGLDEYRKRYFYNRSPRYRKMHLY